MAIVANVNDGVLNYNYTDKNAEKEAASTGSNLGYDQFLQLLCAEMQYQDPLEPTSNTDYVAQMATFSQLEATLSVESTQQNSLASSLVGKHVILATEDTATGNTRYVEGKVDYVMYQNGKCYLSVNDGLYPLETVDTIADDAYYEAATLANTFNSMMKAFPSLDDISLGYQGAAKEARDYYDGLDSYQKDFVKQDDYNKLVSIENRLAELQKAADAAAAEKEKEAEANGEAEEVGEAEGEE